MPHPLIAHSFTKDRVRAMLPAPTMPKLTGQCGVYLAPRSLNWVLGTFLSLSVLRSCAISPSASFIFSQSQKMNRMMVANAADPNTSSVGYLL